MSELCGWTLRVMGIVGSRLERQSSRATPPPPFPLGIWMRRLLSQTAVEKPRASTEIGGGGFRSGSVTRRERGAQGGHLLVLESERPTMPSREFCHSLHGTSVKQLHLADNMSVAVAFERRRAHVHRLLVYIPRFTALCLCRDVFATVWWIPSEFNTSDAGSRKYDPFDDASQSVLARLEENACAMPNVVPSIRPPVRAPRSIHHAVVIDDTEMMVWSGMHDSTVHDAVLFPMKEVMFEGYGRSWSSHVFPDDSECYNLTVPAVGSTIRLHAEAVGSPTASGTPAVRSEVRTQ